MNPEAETAKQARSQRLQPVALKAEAIASDERD